MTDPFDGDYGNAWKFPWPNNDTTTPWNIAGLVHWNDWKPITGENVWGAITGPIQVLSCYLSISLLSVLPLFIASSSTLRRRYLRSHLIICRYCGSLTERGWRLSPPLPPHRLPYVERKKKERKKEGSRKNT